MNLTTNWGYSLKTCSEFPELLSTAEFNTFTANKFSGDGRIEAEIKSASAAIRNYCGWHIYPNLQCTYVERLLYGNGRTKIVGCDMMVQLPSRFVMSVVAVKVNDVEYTDYDCDTNGILHIFDVAKLYIGRKSKIEVVFNSGVPASLVQPVKGVVANRVNHSLSSPNGIASESAGGVSISYNQSWVNSSSSSALADNDKETLDFYKIKGVF